MGRTELSIRMECMLEHRAGGQTYRQIGAVYGVTGGRVSQIFQEIRDLLGVSTDKEAIAEAARRLVDFKPATERPR
ncbi:hypothetical protein ACIA71_01455 [Streptomyces anulatus]